MAIDVSPEPPRADAPTRPTPGEPARVAGGRRTLPDTSIVQLTLARLREFRREPEALFWSFIFPLLLAAGLGLAFRSRPPELLRVVVAESAPGAEALERTLEQGGGILVDIEPDSVALRRLYTGQVALVARPGADGGITYEFDPERPDGRAARFLVNDAVQRAAGRADPVPVEERRVMERGARYIDFFIPGLLGMNLMGSGIWGIGYSIVTARNRKLLKRLAATPMSRAEYLASHLLGRMVFLVAEILLLVGFAVAVFDVPLRGGLLPMLGVALLASLAFSGIGLLIASRVASVEAVSGLANLVMLPQWIFSGVFFSSQHFPDVLQPFIRVLPLTAVVDALRGSMLMGGGYGDLAQHLLIIGAWLLASFGAALALFRWR
jgi:ABC-type multidrug transport system permease subunit